MQLPLWPPKIEQQHATAISLNDLPSWKHARRIAIDTETRDDGLRELGIGIRRGSYAVGFAFALEDGTSHYLPIRHMGGDNLDYKKVLSYIRDQAKVFTGDYVGANLSYDLDYWLEEKVQFHPDAKFRDIQIADPLINELEHSYSLANLAIRYKLPGKDETLLEEALNAYGLNAKGDIWKLPAKYVAPYAVGDVLLPLRILRKQERLIEKNDLWRIWEMETELLPVLVRMRRRGIRIDQSKLGEIEDWSQKEERKALLEIKYLTGATIALGDVWKVKVLAPVLEGVGITLPRTKTGLPSITKDTLKGIDHPVAHKLAWARRVNKLRTTFTASIKRYLANGRIHCTFNQMAREDEDGNRRGARYGRMSATNPNLQQQPNPEKDPAFAGEWRKIYLPEGGTLWASCDYSQQEPRWITHYAARYKLPKGMETAQVYQKNPELDNHAFMAELTGLKRAEAKIIYLGLCYGQGGARLSRSLGHPTRWAVLAGKRGKHAVEYFDNREEALEVRAQRSEGYVWETASQEGKEIIDTFNNKAPFIRLLAQMVKDKADIEGHIKTAGSRVLHFPQNKNGTHDWTHKALNRLIQGTSADQMKKALIEIDRAGHSLMLQVHDEADCSVDDEKEAKEIAQIMQEIMRARVPFVVNTKLGSSWGETE